MQPMLAILDRYVYREVAAPFFIGVGVFTFFLVIDRIYQLTDLVITKSVPFHLVISLLVFMLPAFLTLTFPMALLVAVLLACGRLAGDLEVAALKASGVSPLRLLRPFIVVALLVSLASAGLTLAATPWATAAFQDQLFRILQTRAASGIKERVFNGSFGQLVVYVEEMSASQVALKGLVVSDERDPKLSRIIAAREGRLLTDEENRRITLRFIDGALSETDTGNPRRFRHTAFTLYDMTLPMDARLAAGARAEKPERDLSLPALLQRTRDLERADQPAAPYQVELQKRFALPLASLVFVLMGFPLGTRSHRGGRGVALAITLGIVLAYYVVFTSLEGMALRGHLPAWGAIWLPNVVFALVGAALLRVTTVGLPARWTLPLWRLREAVARRPSAPAAALASERPAPRFRGPRNSSFIIDRYLLREYLMYLAIGLGVGAVLFVVVDLLQTLDRFLRIKPPFVHIVQHFVYRLPGALYEGLPIIVLLATVFLFLSLTRQRELDALKAAGVSLYRTSLPILLMALIISAGAMLFQETLLPDLNGKAEEVDQVRIRGNLPRHLQRQAQLWYRSSDTRFFRMDLVDPVDQSVSGLLLLELDRSFRVTTRLDAAKAQWTAEGWRLSNGVFREFGPANQVRSAPFTSRTLDIPEQISDFIRVNRPPEAMSFLELRTYVRKLRESGHQVGKYVVHLYSKLSFPLIHVIMALVAIPFALVSPRSGGRAVGIGIAIVIAAGYWVVHSMAISFAKADLLPPMLAAWTANIVFAGLGAALFLRART
jgi:LPS export ABC transporter permease LptG/LPS export ABC transporter permease LptF